ncbi:MAG: YhbY family RNA-binding protein [Deltaproteobacteria bacterium]|nr:YhbY family RNA-binding protein [Deltaproteobacteria bacterium]
MKLTRKQEKYLKGLAHSMKPVLMIGKEGVTEAVAKEMQLCLQAHELIKVKIRCDERDDFLRMVRDLEVLSGAALVQTLGRTALFYRRAFPGDKDRKKAMIQLPDEK